MGQVLAESVLPRGDEPVNPFPADVRVQIGENVGVDLQQLLPIGLFFLDTDSFRVLEEQNKNGPQKGPKGDFLQAEAVDEDAIVFADMESLGLWLKGRIGLAILTE